MKKINKIKLGKQLLIFGVLSIVIHWLTAIIYAMSAGYHSPAPGFFIYWLCLNIFSLLAGGFLVIDISKIYSDIKDWVNK